MTVLAENDIKEQVVQLTSDNFKSIVLDSKQDVLVKFHLPWCSLCKNMDEIYKALAKIYAYSEYVVIAEMDWTKHKTDLVEVKGFPTLLFYKKKGGKLEIIKYQRDRTLKDLKEFIKEKQSFQIEDL
ncbi:unnamed protein product (macronuclear) [Paramecium tetraurelia]|uniref:Thioredoxin domain-containing protein n=1 Tax=Paramecium tetraurelia TaxID=5888 RepID=A0DXA3_PARTE|nr:uncharacterized protein GSPATT00021302001 [Paramecium tetraurelia]CAK87670.1 unnamed protein product [Paramecium tetraurelia]|eukprot:XP_001455067.1 hypothetical protein (macronuclear) [Paramecium tetraurelia strain d4-2]